MSQRSSIYRNVNWQKKRLEILERDNWTCRSCGKDKDTLGDALLNVHHIYYISGKKPWEYPDKLLITFCEDCHKKRHEIMLYIHEGLSKMPISAVLGVMELTYASALKEFLAMVGASEDPIDENLLTLAYRLILDAYAEAREDAE